ncbi:MAG: hypothetical protein KDJ25_08420 [Rhodoblastus sp.]|nr:hypothetical protein [Rhodoblastus sp.]
MTSQAARAYSDIFRHADAAQASGVALAHRIAVVASLARRAIYLTALCRVAPQTEATVALSPVEIALLDRAFCGAGVTRTLAEAIAKLAELGGAAQATRRFALPFAVARGLSRIADIQIAVRLRAAKYRDRR